MSTAAQVAVPRLAAPRRAAPRPALLEREEALVALDEALREAMRGRGSVVLVTGEAGIGKTTLVRAFTATAGPAVRVLAGACDDLVTPRPLGPVRDALTAPGGPGPADDVFAALVGELAGPRPSVLVIEDLHWADAATLDVLGYLARRVGDLPAVVVLTCRDGEVRAGDAPHRFLGGLAGRPVRRIRLDPLSPSAVAALAAGSRWSAPTLHVVTAGNPFYVTEALAGGPDDGVPVTVADVVLARIGRLSPAGRAAVELIGVVPTVVDFPLAEALLGDRLPDLAEAEAAGIVVVRQDGAAFRHELARRAVEDSLPRLAQRAAHRAVVAALLRSPAPDPARLVHHASRAGDGDTIVAVAPRAGREAAAAGAHREALAHFAAALEHEPRLDPVGLADVVDDHAWELYNARRFAEAAAGGERAVALRRRLDDQVALGRSLVRLSRHRVMLGDPDGALAAAREALAVHEAAGDVVGTAVAAGHLGSVLALGGPPAEAEICLDRALGLARAAGRADLVALCHNYLSLARTDLDDDARLELLRRSLSGAIEHGEYELAARGFTNLGELLYRFSRFDELEACLDAGEAFTRERGFWSHGYNLAVHRCLLALRRGDWASAERGLADLGRHPDLGMLAGYGVPSYGRLLARRGAPGAEPMLRAAWQRATWERLLPGLVFAGTALAEWGWLADRPDVVAEVVEVWRDHADRPGATPAWAEILRYAQRAGLAVEAFPGAPEPWGAGLRGDWRAAADGWAVLGDPYERALELAGSGRTEPALEALRELEELGAGVAAARLRTQLRERGVRRLPRARRASTQANPAGLTGRQLDVLDLLADGLTNAEIAARLVVSVRTVDTHVAAVLAKLGVRSRREATSVRRSWGEQPA